jgi:hypothetical protein
MHGGHGVGKLKAELKAKNKLTRAKNAAKQLGYTVPDCSTERVSSE